jgi:deoxyribose-phosphate aldolase
MLQPKQTTTNPETNQTGREETDNTQMAKLVLTSLDLTNLSEVSTEEDIETLCSKASTPFGDVAAVCVWPRFVKTATEALRDSNINIATVVNFPRGGDELDKILRDTENALEWGANEIDVVMPYKRFLEQKYEDVTQVLWGVRRTVPNGCLMKVILETGVLERADLVQNAAQIAIQCGADFIKTSTGKTNVSATLGAVEAILQAIRLEGRLVGVKPSGGIKTLNEARQYVELLEKYMGPCSANSTTLRFGASGLYDSLVQELQTGS